MLFLVVSVAAVAVIGVLVVLLIQANGAKNDAEDSLEAVQLDLEETADLLAVQDEEVSDLRDELDAIRVQLEEADEARQGVIEFISASLTLGGELTASESMCMSETMIAERGVSGLLNEFVAFASGDLAESAQLSVIIVMLEAAEACGVSVDAFGGLPETGDVYGLVSAGTLTVCSDIPYAPFEYEVDGEYAGFDVELMEAIADELSLDLEFVATGFDAITSGRAMAANQCDIAASAITITEAREENVDFSDGYFDATQSLLVKDDSGIGNLDDLVGKNLGVQLGTFGEAYAQENAPDGVELISFDNGGELFVALELGNVDGILQDLPVNADRAQKDDTVEVVDTYSTGENYGFATQEEGKEALLEAVNEALQTLRDNGTYDTIFGKYFGGTCGNRFPLMTNCEPELGAGSAEACPEFEGITCEGAVTDVVGVIENDEALEVAVGELVLAYGHEVAVVIVDGVGSRSVEQFAIDLGDTWGVGDPSLNDGVVVVVDLDSRVTTVQHGPGLNDVPRDFNAIAAAGNSFFASGDFDGGLLAIIDALDEAFAAFADL